MAVRNTQQGSLFETAETPATLFPVAYEAILQRIDAVDPVQYGKTRNFLNGAVTRLSPYISRGVISTRQVFMSLLQKGYKLSAIEKMIQELAWRDYFQQVWVALGDRLFEDIKQTQPDVVHHSMPAAVTNATTGILAIDQQIQQLYETGYMHNHVRMYTASICCNIGKAHWLQPAKWLYYYLLDGDAASNHLSWQWVAASFSSKKYYCNQDNINKYCFTTQQNSFLNCRYEELISMPVPSVLHQTTDLNLTTTLPETPLPQIHTHLPTLLYNSYNLDPQWRSTQNANRVLLLEPDHFKKYPVSKKTLDFILALAGNIKGIQVYTGSVNDITKLYPGKPAIISKEHPAFTHYPGSKDSRDWIAPGVTGFYHSFFAYWKKLERIIKTY